VKTGDTQGQISIFDQSIRVWIGLSMMVGSIQNADVLPWSAVGLMLIISAWQGFCPVYAVTGFYPKLLKQG